MINNPKHSIKINNNDSVNVRVSISAIAIGVVSLFMMFTNLVYAQASQKIDSQKVASQAVSEQKLTGQDQIQVIGLFKNAALIRYAGQEKLYRAGQQVSPTIKLISANSKKARLMIDGKIVELKLSHHFKLQGESDNSLANNAQTSNGSNSQDSEKNSAKIIRGNNGMYQTLGFINGRGVKFLVDTGASQVAVNESVANLVGVDYKMKGQRVMVSTAAGSAKAWRVTFAKVKVGNIELHNVDGMVLKGTGPTEVLLGMSFLRQLKMSDDGQVMTLTKKY